MSSHAEELANQMRCETESPEDSCLVISCIGFQIPGVTRLIAMKVIRETDCDVDGFKLTFLEEYPAPAGLYSVNQATKGTRYRSRHQSQDISVAGHSDEREAEENDGSLRGRCDACDTEDTRILLSIQL